MCGTAPTAVDFATILVTFDVGHAKDILTRQPSLEFRTRGDPAMPIRQVIRKWR